MIRNVGMQDRLIRMTLGIFFLVIGLNTGITTLWGLIGSVVGIVGIATAAMIFCPAYKTAGLNSKGTE